MADDDIDEENSDEDYSDEYDRFDKETIAQKAFLDYEKQRQELAVARGGAGLRGKEGLKFLIKMLRVLQCGRPGFIAPQSAVMVGPSIERSKGPQEAKALAERLMLLNEIDVALSELGSEEEQRQMAISCVRELTSADHRALHRFFTLPHIIHHVWTDLGAPFQGEFISSFRGGYDPSYHTANLQDVDAMRHYLDSVVFILDDDDIFISFAHTVAILATSPELLLWLKRNKRFSSSFLSDDTIMRVQSTHCLKLLVGEKGINFNYLQPKAKGIFEDDSSSPEFLSAMNNAFSVEYVRLLLQGGYRFETLKKTKIASRLPLRCLFEAASEDLKKTFQMSDILTFVKNGSTFAFMRDTLVFDCVECLSEFQFEPDVENLKRALLENRYHEQPCGAIGGALVSFGFLKMSDLPPCCLRDPMFCWRPISGVHTEFPRLHSQVYTSLLVFKRYSSSMPRELRNKILILSFGKELSKR